MARVHETFLESYPKMNVDELKNPIIFVVDMIHGFITEGALHDECIMDIEVHIETLIKEAQCRTIFVTDAHPPHTREFNSYPSHCVIGTRESEVIDELQPYVHERIRKNSTNTFTAGEFQSFLQERLDQYNDIVIVGCCTDICILQFALCFNSWLNEHNRKENRIIIPIDCVDTFHAEGIHDAISINEFSIKNMEGNGICIVSALKRG